MKRREFLVLLAATAATRSPVAYAQQPSGMPVIGFLRSGEPPRSWVDAFQQGLRERGYVDGRNVVVEFRFTDGNVDQLSPLAEELVRLKVDVIVASAAPAALAAKKATSSVPIVFVGVYEPVALGLVPGVAHPAGNITGVTDTATGLAGKRLELLRDLLPNLRRIAVLRDGTNPSAPTQVKEAETAAHALGLQLEPMTVRGPEDFDAAFKFMRGADGLLQLESALFTTHRARLAELALKARLPTVSGNREMVAAGSLLAYAPHFPDVYRSAASYVDKILKGAKPADMPIQQPTKFELVINLKTANALGIEIPQSILLRTDVVIE